MPGPVVDYSKKQARIKTRHGEMVVKFFPDVAPGHVRNFVELAQRGYYNGVIFHRIIKNFMIQGGDPQGTGAGGPGYKFPDEFQANPYTLDRYTLCMANSGPNTNGSQFFIVTQLGGVQRLNGKHTVFGELASGLDVLDKIATAKVGANDRPAEPVKMDSVTIEDAR